MNDTSLGMRVYGRALFDAIRCGVANSTNGKIQIGGCAVSSNDCEFCYVLSAKGKLTKAQLLFVRTLAQGIAIGAQLESKLSLENA
jgi:hypothetical protein